jgi:hypothetical protein
MFHDMPHDMVDDILRYRYTTCSVTRVATCFICVRGYSRLVWAVLSVHGGGSRYHASRLGQLTCGYHASVPCVDSAACLTGPNSAECKITVESVQPKFADVPKMNF